jgi:hypothetical protein
VSLMRQYSHHRQHTHRLPPCLVRGSRAVVVVQRGGQEASWAGCMSELLPLLWHCAWTALLDNGSECMSLYVQQGHAARRSVHLVRVSCLFRGGGRSVLHLVVSLCCDITSHCILCHRWTSAPAGRDVITVFAEHEASGWVGSIWFHTAQQQGGLPGHYLRDMCKGCVCGKGGGGRPPWAPYNIMDTKRC